MNEYDFLLPTVITTREIDENGKSFEFTLSSDDPQCEIITPPPFYLRTPEEIRFYVSMINFCSSEHYTVTWGKRSKKTRRQLRNAKMMHGKHGAKRPK